MIEIALLIATSFLVSSGVTALVLRTAKKLRLVQEPNHRSSHEKPTPNGGGLGIVAAGTAAGTWLAIGEPAQWGVVMALSMPLAIVGLFDDIGHLPARLRFGVQVLVCIGLLSALGAMPEVTISRLPFVSNESIEIRGWVLSALLLILGVWWINLFNFMDGIDGIAGVEALFMLLSGAALSAWGNPESVGHVYWLGEVCVAAAVAGFLLLNWPPARIFMGDVGSTWLAFIIFATALLTIREGWLTYGVWLILSAVFVTDATITLLARAVGRKRLHEAHRSHAYQRLSRTLRNDRTKNHRTVTLLVLAINLLWLTPLACACLFLPQLMFVWLGLAYSPLVIGAVLVGAGKSDDTPRAASLLSR